MAIFRKVHTSFWSDTFISDLDRDKKLFYIYILTNERTTQCGIYEISKKQIAFDLGYSIDTVSKLLEYFIKAGKIRYNEITKELAVGNWLKFNGSTSPKVKSCMDKEFALVKDTVLIEYVNSMDTHPQEEEEQEEEKDKEEEQDLGDSSILKTPLEKKFDEFLQYRKEIKSPIVSTSIKAFKEKLTRLSKGNESIAIQILNESIANGWVGIFELKPANKNPYETQPTSVKKL